MPTSRRTPAASRSRRSTRLNDVAVLQYTGGTTGTPKGAMLTHANISVNCQQGAAWATNLRSGQERTLAALPFFHVFAMTAVMNFALQEGAEIVIMPRFVLDDAMKLIDKTKPTVMPGVPTMFIAMLNHPKLQDLRSVVPEVLRFGRGAPAGRRQGAVRENHGLQGGRGLRPVRGVAERDLQSRGGAR